MDTKAKNTYQQMVALKAEFNAKHEGAVVLFRFGDFYEMINDDAETTEKVLGLHVADMRRFGIEGLTHLSAFTRRALDIELPRLIRAGYRVCIADTKD